MVTSSRREKASPCLLARLPTILAYRAPLTSTEIRMHVCRTYAIWKETDLSVRDKFLNFSLVKLLKEFTFPFFFRCKTSKWIVFSFPVVAIVQSFYRIIVTNLRTVNKSERILNRIEDCRIVDTRHFYNCVRKFSPASGSNEWKAKSRVQGNNS